MGTTTFSEGLATSYTNFTDRYIHLWDKKELIAEMGKYHMN